MAKFFFSLEYEVFLIFEEKKYTLVLVVYYDVGYKTEFLKKLLQCWFDDGKLLLTHQRQLSNGSSRGGKLF